MNPDCPKCGNSNFKIWRLPNVGLIHWVLNPGLAVNELMLGQRVPKETPECKSCELTIGERSYVVCPHCHEMHPSRVWAGKNGFRNWLGLVCPSCLRRIPCLWNVFSLLILAVTSPLWYLPYRLYFRDRQVLPPAMSTTPPQVSPGKVFIRMAIFWGGVTAKSCNNQVFQVLQVSVLGSPLYGRFFRAMARHGTIPPQSRRQHHPAYRG